MVYLASVSSNNNVLARKLVTYSSRYIVNSFDHAHK